MFIQVLYFVPLISCLSILINYLLCIEISRQELAASEKEKDRVTVIKDNEIQQMKIKMDQMAREFGDMLKETLDKMSERIEITSSGWEAESSTAPLTKKMEEYHINS